MCRVSPIFFGVGLIDHADFHTHLFGGLSDSSEALFPKQVSRHQADSIELVQRTDVVVHIGTKHPVMSAAFAIETLCLGHLHLTRKGAIQKASISAIQSQHHLEIFVSFVERLEQLDGGFGLRWFPMREVFTTCA